MKEKGIDSSPKLRRLSRVDSWIRRDRHCRVFRLPGFGSVLLLSAFVCIIEHSSGYSRMSMSAVAFTVYPVTRSPLLPLPMHIQTSEALFGVDSTSIVQAIETFDGSSIADPVVVSGVFWSSLKTKILSVLIGQFLASLVFGVLAYFLSSQLNKLGDYFSKHVFRDDKDDDENVNVNVNNRTVEGSTRTPRAMNMNINSTPTIPIDIPKLILCLIIDILGTSSELLPIIGEFTDIAYAPIAALALRSLFKGSNVVFALEFIEEILPLTDILPLATICWVTETYFGDSDLARTLQIGVYSPDYDASVNVNANANANIEVNDGGIDNTNTINNAINMDGRNDMMKGVIDAEVQVIKDPPRFQEDGPTDGKNQ